MKKTKRTPAVKSGRGGQRGRNVGRGRALSSDPPAKKIMRKQTKTAPRQHPAQHVTASINRVIAECDRVDAVLIEITRGAQSDPMPPLTVRRVELSDGQGGTTSGWAVVSGDPQRPLTEEQAKEIVVAMRSVGTSGPMGVAAE